MKPVGHISQTSYNADKYIIFSRPRAEINNKKLMIINPELNITKTKMTD